MKRVLLFRAALRVVPAAWREAVARDLAEEAASGDRGAIWRAWQALGVGLNLRRTVGLDALRSDLRESIRSLVRARGFTAAAILTFALGIGANIAVFSVIDRLMFRPLPFAESGRLVQVHSTWSTSSVPKAWLDVMVGQRILEQSQTIVAMAYADGATSGRRIEGFGTVPAVGALATAVRIRDRERSSWASGPG